ncbi:ki-ras-induced actin-interacting protein-IP3R-interacting domain olf186-M isoform X2 [Amblyomma americanum]
MGDTPSPSPRPQQGAENQRSRRGLHKLQDMKQLCPILELPKGAETPPKSPTSVQEWVNSLPADEPHKAETSNMQPAELASFLHQDSGYQSHLEGHTLEAPISETQDDNLSLGAEARTMDSASLLQPKSLQSSGSGKAMLAELRSKQSSFNSETSGFSTISSMSSVESLLEARREDPEELLLALGFGGPVRDENPVSRIPERFLAHPSQARGVDMRRFVTHQEQLSQRHEAGLPAPMHQSSPPSAISSKIIEAMEQNQKTRSFAATAKLARTSSLLLSSASRGSSDSILEPANREFLERQGEDKMSGHKRLVLGHQTFSFDLESGLMLLTSERRRMRWRWRRAVRIILDKRRKAHDVVSDEALKYPEHAHASLDGPAGDSGLGELISVNGGSVDSTSSDYCATSNNGHKDLSQKEDLLNAEDDDDDGDGEGDLESIPIERHKRPLLYRQSTITEEVGSEQPADLLDPSNQDGSEESGEHTLTELSDLHRALREYKAKHLRCGSSLADLGRKTLQPASDLEAIWQLREEISQEVKRADSMLSSHEMAALLSQPCKDCVSYTELKEKLSKVLSLQKDLCSRIAQILEQGSV